MNPARSLPWQVPPDAMAACAHARAGRPGRAEAAALLAFAGLFVVVNALTLARFPLPWVDEIQFADPAIRWASGHGFTSTVWIAQHADATWAGNAPLYSLLLAGWLGIVGGSIEAVRALNVVLVLALGGVLWWLAVSRRWVASPAARVALVVLVCCAHSVAFAARMGRYDVLGMLLFALAACAWTAAPRASRRWPALAALVALGAAAPATGLALVPAALLWVTLALVFEGRAALPRATAVVSGLAIGAGGLWGVMSWLGVWDAFRASTAAVGVVGQDLGAKVAALPQVLTADKSSLLLALAAVLLWWRLRSRALAFALALAVVVPVVLQAVAKFPVYYGWMALGPLALAVCGSIGDVRLGAWVRGAALSLLVLAVGVGLPLRMAATAWTWQDRDPAAIARHVAASIGPGDHVVADFKAYYAVRERAASLFAPTALQVMRPHERARVSALLIRAEDLGAVRAALGGGRWVEAAAPLTVGTASPAWLRRLVRELAEESHALHLYRRAGDDGARRP